MYKKNLSRLVPQSIYGDCSLSTTGLDRRSVLSCRWGSASGTLQDMRSLLLPLALMKFRVSELLNTLEDHGMSDVDDEGRRGFPESDGPILEKRSIEAEERILEAILGTLDERRARRPHEVTAEVAAPSIGWDMTGGGPSTRRNSTRRLARDFFSKRWPTP